MSSKLKYARQHSKYLVYKRAHQANAKNQSANRKPHKSPSTQSRESLGGRRTSWVRVEYHINKRRLILPCSSYAGTRQVDDKKKLFTDQTQHNHDNYRCPLRYPSPTNPTYIYVTSSTSLVSPHKMIPVSRINSRQTRRGGWWSFF